MPSPRPRSRFRQSLYLIAALLCPVNGAAEITASADTHPIIPRFAPPSVAPGVVLPPVVTPEAPTTPGIAAGSTIKVHGYRIVGNTVLPAAVVRDITAPYTGRELTFADLQTLRDALTRAYVDRGYVTSGAVLPEQEIVDGIVTLVMVEGRLSQVLVESDGRYRSEVIAAPLRRAAEPVVNVRALEEALQILQQDDRIRRIEAELAPEGRRGEALLRVRVVEAPPYRVTLGADNYTSPTIGAEGLHLRLAHGNVTGRGDRATAEITVTEGLREGSAMYEIPVAPTGTTFAIYVRGNTAEVTDDEFADLDIESNTETYGVALRPALTRTLHQRLDLMVSGEYRRSESFLFGSGFSFAEGPEEGVARIAVLRVGPDWSYRDRHQAIAARAVLSWGLGAFGATDNRGDVPDGKFLAVLGQFQWAHRLGWHDAGLIWRADVQLSQAPLLGMEQLALGGHATVRGYRENALVRDQGGVLSLEGRLPVWRGGAEAAVVEVAPFVDAGHGANRNRDTAGPDTLVSAGVGLVGTLRGLGFRVDWAHAFTDIEPAGEHDLQDEGVHFALEVSWPQRREDRP